MAQTCGGNEEGSGSDQIILLILGQISVSSIRSVHVKLGSSISLQPRRKS